MYERVNSRNECSLYSLKKIRKFNIYLKKNRIWLFLTLTITSWKIELTTKKFPIS